MPDTTTQPAAAGATVEAGGAETRRGAASPLAWPRADHDASAYCQDRPWSLRETLVYSLGADAYHTVRLLRRWVERLDAYVVDQKRYERWLGGRALRHQHCQVCNRGFTARADARYSSTACKGRAQRSRRKGAKA